MYEDFQKRLREIDDLLVLKFNHSRRCWEIYRKERRVYPLGKIAGVTLTEMRNHLRFILRIQTSGKYREPAEDIIQELQRMDSWRRLRPVLDFGVELRKAEFEEEKQREKIWEM